MTLFTELDDEWTQLSVSPVAVHQLTAWAIEDVQLRCFDDLRAMVDFAQEVGHPEESDQVLACLARRSVDDGLAARALLQAVLYGLIKIAADFKTGADSDDEAASVVVAAAYSRIRTYPFRRRPKRIAANILLDARQATSRTLFRPRVRQLLVDDVSVHLSESTDPTPTEELLSLVAEAVRAERISKEDARLIVLTRVADVSVNTIAISRGCPAQTLRQRRLRAETALAAAAIAEAVA